MFQPALSSLRPPSLHAPERRLGVNGSALGDAALVSGAAPRPAALLAELRISTAGAWST
jgi:hypothetical protein